MNTDFARNIWQGLQQTPKRISSKYLYDKRGSQLFDSITEQPEYYLTRVEKFILQTQFERLNDLISDVDDVVEFGPGDGSKAKIVLGQMLNVNQRELSYTAVDISPSAIAHCFSRLEQNKRLKLKSWVGDYSNFTSEASEHGKLFLFLGSNIGNYEPEKAKKLLLHFRSWMSHKDLLIIGFDKKKDIQKLTAAYNDKAGLTKDFNFNLLERMNRELGANFNPNFFSHHGVYNPLIGAMQSFLVSSKNQTITFGTLNEKVSFDLGEAIHVENSYKYSDTDILSLAEECGFLGVASLEDENKLFADSVWKIKTD